MFSGGILTSSRTAMRPSMAIDEALLDSNFSYDIVDLDSGVVRVIKDRRLGYTGAEITLGVDEIMVDLLKAEWI